MTSAEQIIAIAPDLGTRLNVENKKLVAYGQLSDQLRSLLRDHKDEVLDLLRHDRTRAILAAATAEGVTVKLDERRDRVRLAIVGKPSPLLDARIRRHMGELIAYLAGRDGDVS